MSTGSTASPGAMMGSGNVMSCRTESVRLGKTAFCIAGGIRIDIAEAVLLELIQRYLQ